MLFLSECRVLRDPYRLSTLSDVSPVVSFHGCQSTALSLIKCCNWISINLWSNTFCLFQLSSINGRQVVLGIKASPQIRYFRLWITSSLTCFGELRIYVWWAKHNCLPPYWLLASLSVHLMYGPRRLLIELHGWRSARFSRWLPVATIDWMAEKRNSTIFHWEESISIVIERTLIRGSMS